jgi:O-antigen biosynthesis protein WbqP|tara:strand:- start:1202 stop:1795 length:594 start_codon:yes stop_codon:yes gene_type:complete
MSKKYIDSTKLTKRFIDFFLTLIAISISLIPMIVIAIIVRLNSSGPALYWSNRVGRDNKIFSMPKFRTMLVDTPQVATHLLKDPILNMTTIGIFLRQYSLDELPQLWCILLGYMSFVGPRPALYNQNDLIKYRTEEGISNLIPGLTGWAQVNGRDDLEILEKVALDKEYSRRKSILFDIYIIWLTILKVLSRDGISH